VSNDDFRRDLNRTFDDVSGQPNANLRERVRSAVTEAPRAREPYWLAGVAAAVIAVLIIGVLFVANPLKRTPSTVGGVNPTPSASASPSVQPTPSASPTAESFVCTNETIQSLSQGTQPPVIYISGLRTGTHSGYDRLTIDLANGVPASVEITTERGTTFTLSPSGMQATLKGQNGILITIRGADLHTQYTGSIDIVTGYHTLAEVRRVQDFEGVVQLGLGVNGPACYHAYFLTNPNRLVIDVQASS
jgi:hypothetical protein